MTLRILDHDGDADARLVAIILHRLRLTSLVLTPADEHGMAQDIVGHRLVIGNVPGTGSIELRIVEDADLPDGVQPLQ